MRDKTEIIRAIDQYADMIKRICFYYLKNKEDTEDIFQNVFLKYMLYEESFVDKEHEKSWLIRVSINACKDYLRSFSRKRTVSIETMSEIKTELTKENKELLEALLSLPSKYKDVIYLYYYEGYTAIEIGHILGKKENTVYSLLSRGRKLLRKKLGGEEFER